MLPISGTVGPATRSRPYPKRVALLASLVVVPLAAACGGDDDASGPAATTAASSAATSSTPTAAATTTASGPQTLPQSDLEPGTYTTGTFRPSTTFRVGKGWTVQGELPYGVALAPADPDTVRTVSITAVKWIIDKPLITDAELKTQRQRHVKPAPHDLVRWLRSNPYLQLTAPKPVRVAGLPATQFDVTVRGVPRGLNTCDQFAPRRCVTLLAITQEEGIELAELEGVPSRYTLLEFKGQPILVTVSAETGKLDAFFGGPAAEILSTLSFR